MRVLLLNPPYEVGVTPPLGLAYLHAVLEKEGKDASLVDAWNWSIGEICRFVHRNEYDLVGLSITTPHRFEVIDIARRIKQSHPGTSIVLGGPHATYMSEQMLTHYPFIDYIVRGEGEYKLLNLVESLESRKSLDNVGGLSFRSSGKVVSTEDAPYIQRLDDIPFPSYKNLDLKSYAPYEDSPPGFNKVTRAPLISSRGCTYRCIFCSSSCFWGHKWRFHSPAYVVNLMEYLSREFDANYQRFFDDNFMANPKRVIQICTELRKRGLHRQIIWRCEGRPDVSSREMYQSMKDAGCFLIEFGVESGTEEGLSFLGKRYTLDQIRTTFRVTKELGFVRKAFIILGGPHETEKTIAKTRKFIEEIDPDRINVFLLTIFPGTDIYELARREGRVTEDIWLKRSSKEPTTRYWHDCPTYHPKMKLKDLEREANRMMYWWHVEVKRRSLFYYERDFLFFMLKHYVMSGKFRRILSNLRWILCGRVK